ncbi:hypothetical protein D3C75_605490 [compost metagenome]
MLKERFSLVSSLIQDGTIQILSRDQNGYVEVKVPKMLWMQLTGEDLVRGIQGKFTTDFYRDVQSEVLTTLEKDVVVRVIL